MAHMQTNNPGKGADVTLRRLVKYYGKSRVVDDVDLEIGAGEFLTLLGPSGSGKTTTLMMVAGFIQPSSGEILIGGKLVTQKPPYKRNIGMVFQNYALFPHLNVFQNVAFPLVERRMLKATIQRKVEEALSSVKLTGYENRRIHQLSGGQQQRVALARAIVYESPLLLMDEPLGALDKKLREHMQLELMELQRSLGVTVIYVTHDQQEALVMSSRIAIMDNGRIQQIGRPTEIYQRPTSPFVADFLGESNLVEAVVETIQGDQALLKVSDGLVLAAKGATLAAGCRVQAMIRPEKINLAPTQAGVPSSQPTGWPGVIENVIYLGDVTRYQVRAPGGPLLMVNIANRREAIPLAQGQAVALSWEEADWLAFD